MGQKVLLLGILLLYYSLSHELVPVILGPVSAHELYNASLPSKAESTSKDSSNCLNTPARDVLVGKLFTRIFGPIRLGPNDHNL